MLSGVTSLERVETALRHEEPDRVPCVPELCLPSIRISRVPYSEYCTNSKKLARSLLASWRRFKYDGITVDSDTFVTASGFGLKVRIKGNEVPRGIGAVVETEEDVDGLQIPDPHKDGRMPVWIEAAEIIVEKVGRKVWIMGRADQGPFDLAAELRGIERFVVDLYKNPSLAHKLLRKTTEASVEFAKAMYETGVHMTAFGDSIGGPDFISPKLYEEFAHPYEREAFRELRRKGVRASLHICGAATPILPLMAETGADILEIDQKVDIGKAKEIVGAKTSLMGNLDPTGVLFLGTPETVEKASRECMMKAGKGGGLILSSGCDVPMRTPFRNLDTMMHAVRKYGKYPLDISA
jgi:uroporphyrinogen decarboxylase